MAEILVCCSLPPVYTKLMLTRYSQVSEQQSLPPVNATPGPFDLDDELSGHFHKHIDNPNNSTGRNKWDKLCHGGSFQNLASRSQGQGYEARRNDGRSRALGRCPRGSGRLRGEETDMDISEQHWLELEKNGMLGARNEGAVLMGESGWYL